MAIVTWTAPAAADVPTWGAALAGLTNGSYSLSSAIDNTAGLYENAAIQFISNVNTTAGAGAPFIGYTLLYAFDGSTYPNPPSGNAATGIPQTASIPAVASAVFTIGHTQPFLILPFKFKILLFNSLGATITAAANTVTSNMFRWSETVA